MTAKSDVIVIGAGVFGLATAWEVAKTGRSVTVLDRAPVGSEASGFALGRIDPLLKGSGSTGETERDSPIGELARPAAQAEVSRLSFDVHREMTAQIQEISGIDVEIDEQPTLQLFYDEAERKFAEEYAARWTAEGFPSELLSADEARKLDKRYAVPEFGGAIIEGPYFIDSLKFALALAACARNAGVRFETAQVNSIAPANVTNLHTDQGHYEADVVVIAAGPWSTELLKPNGVNLPVFPSKGEILRLKPLDSGRFGAHLHGPCSLVQKKDDLIWVAATASDDGFKREPTKDAQLQLIANAKLMMPETVNSEIAMHTVCFRPATPDDLPVVGQASLPGNVLAASGGGGSGIVHCLLIGRQVAGMIESGSENPELDGVALSRFS